MSETLPRNDHWTTCDDAALMQGIRCQQPAALEALYDRYAAQVRNLCHRVTRRHDLADEATLDTFWELWNRPQRFDSSRSSPGAYVFMLARCRAIDLLRSERSQKDREHRAAAREPSPASGHRLPAAPSAPPTPDDAPDESPGLQTALGRISPKSCEALRLCVLNGLTAQQAATSLGIPLGTMKSRVRKGIIQLQAQLRTP